MRKSIIMGAIAGMLAVALPSQAWAEPNWVYVTEDNRFTVYIDLNSIRRVGSIVRYWQRSLYVNSPRGEKERRTLFENDCPNRQFRVLRTIAYLVDGTYEPQAGSTIWDHIVPGSIGDNMHDFVCRQ